MILLTTVPHTGTRFFIELIEKATGHEHHIMRARTEPDSRQLLQGYPFATCHIEPGNWQLLNWYIDDFQPLVVTTARWPRDVEASWRKRGLKLDKMVEGNTLQKQLIRERDPIVVSVDAPNRAERLEQLAQAIGSRLETDWQPVGSWSHLRDGPVAHRH